MSDWTCIRTNCSEPVRPGPGTVLCAAHAEGNAPEPTTPKDANRYRCTTTGCDNHLARVGRFHCVGHRHRETRNTR